MQNNLEFILSPDILKGIPFDRYEQNFSFIVNGKEYRTSRFLADLISPTIRQYHLIDETLDEFPLDLKEDNANLTFSDFLKIISFEKIEITQEQLQYYTQILFLLGNREIITKSFPFMKENISLNNVFDRIIYKKKYFQQSFKTNEQEKETLENDIILDIPQEILQEEIDFLSSHFYEIDHEKLKKIGASLIEKVISNQLLLLENEDSLFQFITSLYSENTSLSYLFENVDFLNISDNCIEQFYEIFDLNDINHSIWSELIKRSISTQKVPSKHNYKKEKGKQKEEQAQPSNEQVDENRYSLNVRLPNGRFSLFHCKPTDLVQNLLYLISDEIAIDPFHLFLLYEGIRLDNNQPISFYNIPNGSMVASMVSLT